MPEPQYLKCLLRLLNPGETEPPPVRWYGQSASKTLGSIPGLDAPGIRDPWYWAANADTCIEWLHQAHDKAPRYQSITSKQPGFDCDKFAHCLVSFFYKRGHNRIWEVWGMTPQGYHAWNVFDNELGRFEVEPQNCEIWEIGTRPSEYQITTWIVPKPTQ